MIENENLVFNKTMTITYIESMFAFQLLNYWMGVDTKQVEENQKVTSLARSTIEIFHLIVNQMTTIN